MNRNNIHCAIIDCTESNIIIFLNNVGLLLYLLFINKVFVAPNVIIPRVQENPVVG